MQAEGNPLTRQLPNCTPQHPGALENISKYSIFAQFMCIIPSNGY